MIHPPGEMGLARHGNDSALILLEESLKHATKSVIYPGNLGLDEQVVLGLSAFGDAGA